MGAAEPSATEAAGRSSLFVCARGAAPQPGPSLQVSGARGILQQRVLRGERRQRGAVGAGGAGRGGGGAHVQRFVVGGVAAVQRVGDGDQAALGAGPVGARLRLSSRALLLLGVLVLAQVGLEGRGCAQRRPRLPPRNSGTGPGLRSPPVSRPAATAPAGTRTARPVGAASRSTRCPRRPPPPAPRTAPPRPPRPRRQRASLRPPAGKRSVTAGGGGARGSNAPLRSAPRLPHSPARAAPRAGAAAAARRGRG